ncbi:hypothetical protein FRC01_009567, partial [Tulasnella sp. 417]
MTTSHRDVTRDAEKASEHFQRNQNLPVNTLPPEILHLVFLPVAGFNRAHYSCLLPLRMVCKYWAEVIDSSPELWEPIGSYHHPELQALIIQNSRNHPLSVEYDETTWDDDPEGHVKMAAFSSLIKSTATRWKALVNRLARSTGSDSWTLSLPLHNLRRLQITAPSWRDLRSSLDAPKLSNLSINGCSLDLRPLSGLQVLTLGSTNPTFCEFMAVLKASPCLQFLSLRKTWFRTGIEQLPNSSNNKVFLPQLHGLQVYKVSAQSTHFLLECIEAPSLEIFTVTMRYKYIAEDCTQLCESSGRYIGAFPLPLSKGARVSIGVIEQQFKFGVGGRTVVIRSPAWTRDDGPQRKLEYFASAIKRLDHRACEEVRILELDCWDEGRVPEYLRIVHSRFPRIDKIVLGDARAVETQIGAVFQYLSSPSQMELTEEWLLPKLKRIEVDICTSTDTEVVERIVYLIKARQAAEQTEEITELKISCVAGEIEPGTLEMIRQYVMLFDLTEV